MDICYVIVNILTLLGNFCLKYLYSKNILTYNSLYINKTISLQSISSHPTAIQAHQRRGTNFAEIKIDIALPTKDFQVSSARINNLLEII
jgi:hypothetical protein